MVEGEVQIDVDRGLAVPGDEAPALNGILSGGGKHVVAADGFDGGYFAIGCNGGLNLNDASDAHALGNLRIDGSDALLDGAILGVKSYGQQHRNEGKTRERCKGATWRWTISFEERKSHR